MSFVWTGIHDAHLVGKRANLVLTDKQVRERSSSDDGLLMAHVILKEEKVFARKRPARK